MTVVQTYNLLSEKWFTHASPTLFNSGTCRPQMSRYCCLLNTFFDIQHVLMYNCGLCVASLPAALRAAQICRYLVYSEADFEVFRPAGATRCTDWGEIWHPPCNDKGVGPPKLKFLLRFDENVEYKRPAGAYPLRDFHKICRVCTRFQDALGVKIWLDLLKGLWSYGGFKLRGSGFPRIFSAP